MSSDDRNDHESTWTCQRCRCEVPDTMDACWNCGADRDGVPDPDFEKEPADTPLSDGSSPKLRRGLRCSKCGSMKVIPDATIEDQGHRSDGYLRVVVYGRPSAIIMKDRMYGVLTADICADCGHAELKVANAQNLFNHYLKSLEQD
jgi:hypothetical protein